MATSRYYNETISWITNFDYGNNNYNGSDYTYNTLFC